MRYDPAARKRYHRRPVGEGRARRGVAFAAGGAGTAACGRAAATAAAAAAAAATTTTITTAAAAAAAVVSVAVHSLRHTYAIPVCNRRLRSSLISSLMAKDPNSRLGRNGPDEVKNPPWFSGTDWEAMYNQRIRPPFVPEKHFSKHKAERTKSKVAMETLKTTFKPYSSPQRQSERCSGSDQTQDLDEGGSAAASPKSDTGASSPLAGSGVAAARVLKATPQTPQHASVTAPVPGALDLAKSFEQHQHTFKSTQGLALVHAVTGVVVQADVSFRSMMGHTTADYEILQYISEADHQCVKEALANAALSEQRLRVNMPALGSTVDLHLVMSTDCEASVLWWQTVVPPS